MKHYPIPRTKTLYAIWTWKFVAMAMIERVARDLEEILCDVFDMDTIPLAPIISEPLRRKNCSIASEPWLFLEKNNNKAIGIPLTCCIQVSNDISHSLAYLVCLIPSPCVSPHPQKPNKRLPSASTFTSR